MSAGESQPLSYGERHPGYVLNISSLCKQPWHTPSVEETATIASCLHKLNCTPEAIEMTQEVLLNISITHPQRNKIYHNLAIFCIAERRHAEALTAILQVRLGGPDDFPSIYCQESALLEISTDCCDDPSLVAVKECAHRAYLALELDGSTLHKIGIGCAALGILSIASGTTSWQLQ